MTPPDPPEGGAEGGRTEEGPVEEGPVDPIQLVATVSHELRSPLTSIKGFTNLLISRWDGMAEGRKLELLEQIRLDADRVTRMLTELLDISRLETGRLHLSPRPVDLAALACSVVDKVALHHADLDATVTVSDAVPEVVADADKLEQVLTNLVENAAKYGSPVGLVVEGSVADDGAGVVVTVTDRGEGIPPEDLPRVFERFFRREEGRPTGTGLGLWITRGLVEAHGGTVEATSTVGVGSTFRVTLPLTPPTPSP